jgi:AsmA protein
MSRIIKIVFVLLAAAVGIIAVAAVALLLFFDPNDYKEEISAGVRDATGRELNIEGDLSLSVFPWLAIEVGRADLGNAPGFSDEPFLTFRSASLSVRLLPLIFQQQARIGTASIDGLVVNLEVKANGATNWDDFSSADGAGEDATDAAGEPAEFSVSNIVVSDAKVTYSDAQAGATYTLNDLNFETGGVEVNKPIDLEAEFDFAMTPDDLGGHLAIRGTATMSEGGAELSLAGLNVAGELTGITSQPAAFNFDSRELHIDTVTETATLGEMDLNILGIAMSADVAPFSYAGTPQPKAKLYVQEFSLKDLLQALDIEPPATADPAAMTRVSFAAQAAVGEQDIALTDLSLEMDDSTMTGTLSLPTTAGGPLRFDLSVDSINLDDYMAPADDGLAADNADDGDIEIPVDMIRTLNANGKFRIERASLSGLEFTNVQLGLAGADGRLRLNPVSAELYDGTYMGDVRIDASTDIPALSVNERISGVNLASLAKSMFEQDNITGQINGSFVLAGKGRSVAAIRQDLDGTMSFELADGAWEGVDIWHQMRTARATFKQETPPEPKLPARTEFTSMKASGQVTDGIFQNNDLQAELPFLQLSGKGMVDLNAAQINYSLQARVLEKPEFMDDATAAEIRDFTKIVIPLKITGPLSKPSIQPDIEAVFRQQVEEAIDEKKDELKDRLLKRLLGGDEEETTEDAPEEEVPEKKSTKQLLKDLIGN